MKSITTLLLSLLFVVSVFAQELQYSVRGSYTATIKKEQLNNAETMQDLKATYPSSWITNYGTVSVKTISNGITLFYLSRNDTLSAEQKKLLSSAVIGTEILIDINHFYSNSVTGVLEPRDVHFSFTVVPEVEAEYYGGEVKLNAFLKEKAINNIPEALAQKFDQAVVIFTVNEKGDIANAYIEKSSGDPKVDKMLLSAVNKMSKWKPAEDEEGIKVSQQFQFTVGYPGC